VRLARSSVYIPWAALLAPRTLQGVNTKGSCQKCGLPTNEFFIGEIVEADCAEEFMTAGSPDVGKINPITLTMPDNRFWSVGSRIGQAWSIGKEYRPRGTACRAPTCIESVPVSAVSDQPPLEASADAHTPGCTQMSVSLEHPQTPTLPGSLHVGSQAPHSQSHQLSL
jgi:hypothetical protein